MRFSRRARRRLILATTVVVVLGGGLLTFKLIRGVQQSRLVENARADGMDAFERGDHPKALESLSYYIQHVKDDVEALLAFAHSRLSVPTTDGHHIVEALGLFRESLRLLDDGAAVPEPERRADETLRELVELYGLVGMRFEQIKTANRLLRDDPDDVEALSARAIALYGERRFDEALGDATRLSVLEPAGLQWRQLQLEVMRGGGRPEHEIVALCQSWIREDPGNVSYQVLKAGLLAAAGKTEEARATIVAAAEAGADSLEVLQAMTALLDDLGMPDIARMVIASAKEKFPRAQWVREAIVHRSWRAGSLEPARAELQAVEGEFDTLVPGLLKLKTLLLCAANEGDAARVVLAELATRESDEALRAWARAIEARLDLQETGWTESVETIRHAILLQPRDPVLHLVKGEAYQKVGETTLAAEAFGQAFRLDTNWTAAGMNYAETLLQLGRTDEAYAVSRHVLRRADRSALRPYVVYARAFLAVLDRGGPARFNDSMLGQGGSVVRVFEGIVEQLPGEPEVASLLAEAYVRTGRADKAARFMTRAMDRDPVVPAVMIALAHVSLRHEMALEGELVEHARAVAGLTLPVAFAQATIDARGGRFDEGLAVIDEAIAAADETVARSRSVRQARLAYLLEMDHPEAGTALHEYVGVFSDSAAALSYVLGVNEAWRDRPLIETTIGHLETLIGAGAQKVRLARAQQRIRFQADDEAALAEAIMLLGEVLEQTPGSLAALTFMAEASMLGDHPSSQRAIEHLERAVAEYPGQVQLYPPLIGWLQSRGDFETAERYLEQMHKMSSTDQRFKRAELQLLQRQGDFESALVQASAMFDERSDDTDQLVLAAMHRRAGEIREAEAIYQRLLERDASAVVVVAQAASFYAGTGRFEKGLQLLLDLDETAVNKPLLLGSFHRRLGRLEDAEEWLTLATRRTPALPEAWNELARLLLDRGEATRALAAAEQGLEVDPENLALRGTIALARLAGDASGRSEAIDLLRQVGGDNRDLVALLELLERVPADGSGSDGSALDDTLLADARKLLKTNGSLPAAWNLVIRLHVRGRRIDEAVDLARQAVGRFPAQAEPSRWATHLLMNEQRWQEALVEAEEWRRRSLHDPLDADIAIGRLLLEMGRPEDALRQLAAHESKLGRQARRRPDGATVWLWALLGTERHDQASSFAAPLLETPEWRRRLIDLCGRLAPATAERALGMISLEQLEQLDQLEELLLVAAAWQKIAIRGDRREPFVQLDAWAAAAEAGAEDPAHARLLRAAAAEGLDDPATAERLYRQVLETQPEQALALNNLAYLLLGLDRAREALPYAERARVIERDHPDILDTYGSILRALGRTDEAETVLRRSLDLRPDDPRLRLSLVDLLIDQGEILQAEENLQLVERTLQASGTGPGVRARAQGLRQRIDKVVSSVEP